MENKGWIKIHRKILDNPVVMKDADHLAVWVYLMLNATHGDTQALFKGEKITLKAGQLLTGRKSISDKLSINESKVKRILTSFENDQQIDRQRSNKNSLITVLNWESYQRNDQQSDQQVTSKRPASDQQVTTNKNVRMKECKKNNNKGVENDSINYQQIADLYNETCVSFPRIRSLSDARKKAIKARLHSHTMDEFKILFQKAENSDFLKGKNNRDWSATFDWLIKDSNMVKVLDGNYDNKDQRKTQSSSQFDYSVLNRNQEPITLSDDEYF